MSTQQPKAVQIADLFATYKTPEGQIVIDLPSGITVKFRFPLDATEYMMISHASNRFARTLKNGTTPAEWAPFLPVAEAVARQCYWLHALAQEPAISQPEALQMAKECGALVPFLYAELMGKLGALYTNAEAEEIESLGEA